MPTRRGLILFLAGMALFVAGRFLALAELSTVGLVLMAIVLVMITTVWLQLVRAKVVQLRVVRLHPASNVFANRPFPVTLRASGRFTRLPYCTIVENLMNIETRAVETDPDLARRSLTAGLCRSGDLTYERTLSRGLHQLGPGRISIFDSLGLARIPFSQLPTTTVHVWPEIRFLDMLLVGRLFEMSASNADHEPGDLREYVVGDDLRHVHWPTSARADRLMVRDRQRTNRADRTNLVIADITAPSNAKDFELVLSVAASLLYSVDPLEQVELVLVGPSGHTRHAGAEKAMAALCRAVPDREPSVGEFSLLEILDTGVVVATDETIVPVNARGPVIRCSSRGVGEQQEGSYSVFRIPSLDRLESEFDHAIHLSSRSGR